MILTRLFLFAAAAFAMVGATSVAAQGTDYSREFVEAVHKSDGNKATELIGTRPAGLVNARDVDGNTGLIIALARHDDDWTGFLLNSGADPNLAGMNGDTPLIVAARAGSIDALGWLLGLGAKVDSNNRSGETALIVAVQLRESAVVKALLRSGADPDRADHVAGYSARDYAARDTRARDILKAIEEKKPKPGPTPAH